MTNFDKLMENLRVTYLITLQLKYYHKYSINKLFIACKKMQIQGSYVQKDYDECVHLTFSQRTILVIDSHTSTQYKVLHSVEVISVSRVLWVSVDVMGGNKNIEAAKNKEVHLHFTQLPPFKFKLDSRVILVCDGINLFVRIQ